MCTYQFVPDHQQVSFSNCSATTYLSMAGNGKVFIVACIVAIVVPAVIEGCDRDHCCCPDDGQLRATTTGATVRFVWTSTARGCKNTGLVYTTCSLTSSNVCDGNGFDLGKNGKAVNLVSPAGSCQRYDMTCQSNSCQNTNDWDGTYQMSGSKTVVFSTMMLLVAALVALSV